MVDAIFADSRLAGVYDALDPDRRDLDAYVAMVEEFGARTVLDIGCGTGTFACLLARRGVDVVAVDPAEASLDVARAKPGAELVRWVHADAGALPPVAVDAAFMTGNVAQVFLSDDDWLSTLGHVSSALRPGGRLVFETRDPVRRAWEQWVPDATRRTIDHPQAGRVGPRSTSPSRPPSSICWRSVTRRIDLVVSGCSSPSGRGPVSSAGERRRTRMATYVLIPGAGSDSWYWHLVVPRLEALGHDAIAVDLPCSDDTADFRHYTDVVVDAIGQRQDLIVVAQSLGGFTAPLVCARVPARLLVLVAAMVPRFGESAGDWWANTGHVFPDPFDPAEVFTHDLPPELAAEINDHVTEQSGRPFEDPWPLSAWPDVPTRFVLCRDDRFFPADFQRRVVRERLGFEPDEMGGGHLPALARPDELVAWLERYREEAGIAAGAAHTL